MSVKLATINDILTRVGLVLVVQYPTYGSNDPIALELLRWSTYNKRVELQNQLYDSDKE